MYNLYVNLHIQLAYTTCSYYLWIQDVLVLVRKIYQERFIRSSGPTAGLIFSGVFYTVHLTSIQGLSDILLGNLPRPDPAHGAGQVSRESQVVRLTLSRADVG